MDPIFCKALLGVADAVVSVDACAGAMATVRAAEIQAGAAEEVGFLTLLASIGAIIAGYIAYSGQVRAATIQVKSMERNDIAEQSAIVSGFRMQVREVYKELLEISTQINHRRKDTKISKLSTSLTKSSDYIRSSWPIRWDRVYRGKELKQCAEEFYENIRGILSEAESVDYTAPISDSHPLIKEHYKEYLESLNKKLQAAIEKYIQIETYLSMEIYASVTLSDPTSS